MTYISVIKSGPYTTIQDAGRRGYQHLGVPASGALDLDALQIGNQLLQNPKGTNALEICFGGAEILFHDHRFVIITGSEGVQITKQTKQGRTALYPAGAIIELHAQDRLIIAPFGDSLSCLLCLSGGCDVPPIYSSTATTPNVGIGGYQGRILQQGDDIPLAPCQILPPINDKIDASFFTKPQRLRIMAGPQNDWFTPDGLANLTTSSYKILPQSNRMGMRLSGPTLHHKGPADIISDGMVRGAIQVPADGQPIIAMADHGTMGGYTKIATVIAADLSAMGRLRPHDVVQFEMVTSEEAGHALQKQTALKKAIFHQLPHRP